MNSSYREDIEGLRAIAVLAVVLFHIWPESLVGGFLGVDMFFVISGYLITGNIQRSRENGRFSYLSFYNRRIRRLLPALAFLLAVTSIAAIVLLLPEDLIEFSLSALFSAVSAANVFFTFFADSGYFAQDSSEKPLLHLWSLGVEEQFYLVWPALLGVLLVRFSRVNRTAIVVIVAVLSVLLAEYLMDRAPLFTYYQLPTRASELLIGCAVSLACRSSVSCSFTVRSVLASAGLVSVFLSLHLLSEEQGFPGVSSLPVTLGTAALIIAGSGGSHVFSRILGLAPVVWVGNLSYSLYLWHWPPLAFARYLHFEIDLALGSLLFLGMVLMSMISYYVVENPIRRRSAAFNVSVKQFLVAPAAILFPLVLLLILLDGYVPGQDNKNIAEQLRIAEQHQPAFSATEVLQKPTLRSSDLSDPQFVVGPGDGEPAAMLWGDSHAAHFVGMLGVFAEASGFSFRNASHSACPPVFGEADSFVAGKYRSRCDASRQVVQQELHGYDVVILSASWEIYQRRSEQFWPAFIQTVESLLGNGSRVIILGYLQRMPKFDRDCLSKRSKVSMLDCDTSNLAFPGPEAYQFNELARTFAKETNGVLFFDPNQFLCLEGHCSGFIEEELVYFDSGHLTHRGSKLLGRRILGLGGVPDEFARLDAVTGALSQ